LDEDHFRVLGVLSSVRPTLEIKLVVCIISSVGASALAVLLGRNQGPTVLVNACGIDHSVLADGLRGNTRLQSLKISNFGSTEDGNREILAIVGALRENKGLVVLGIWDGFTMSDETWNALCDSLKTHPTLQVLSLKLRLTDAPSQSIETRRHDKSEHFHLHDNFFGFRFIPNMSFSKSQSFLISW
jgi:hypothetical protein